MEVFMLCKGKVNNMLLVITILFIFFLMGCAEKANIITYNASEEDHILKTYYEMEDGTWKCDDVSYKYRLELTGRMLNAEQDSYYVVLTDNNNLTFEDVSKSLYGSLIKDSEIMRGSVMVEMK